jgi:hypothetical protein
VFLSTPGRDSLRYGLDDVATYIAVANVRNE